MQITTTQAVDQKQQRRWTFPLSFQYIATIQHKFETEKLGSLDGPTLSSVKGGLFKSLQNKFLRIPSHQKEKKQ